MKSFQSQSHYEVLEVSVGASEGDIRSALERLLRLYAEDQVALYGLIDDARARALRGRLQEAAAVLLDEARRAAYDASIGLPPKEPLTPKPAPHPGPRETGAGWGGSFSFVASSPPAPVARTSFVYTVTAPVHVVAQPVVVLAAPQAPAPVRVEAPASPAKLDEARASWPVEAPVSAVPPEVASGPSAERSERTVTPAEPPAALVGGDARSSAERPAVPTPGSGSESPVSASAASGGPASREAVTPEAALPDQTSAAPTTAAPVSAAPVSAAPVSAAPVSAAPVSAAPVSAAPVSAAPVSAAPVSAAPVSAAPVSAAPVSAAPVSAAPTTAAPVSESPVSAAPAMLTSTDSAPAAGVSEAVAAPVPPPSLAETESDVTAGSEPAHSEPVARVSASEEPLAGPAAAASPTEPARVLAGAPGVEQPGALQSPPSAITARRSGDDGPEAPPTGRERDAEIPEALVPAEGADSMAIVPTRPFAPREYRAPERPRPYEVPPGVEFNGDLLRQVRMARGLSLLQLSERTRIGVRHIENLEGDRYDQLPAMVYLRGMLMSLARELGLDGLRVSKSYLTFVEAHLTKSRG